MSGLPHSLTIQDVLFKVQQKRLTVVELLQSCHSRINDREPQVHAWEYLALEQARQQAMEWDQRFQRKSAEEVVKLITDYPLAGIPVAVKDIFATLDMPTGWGTPAYRGRYLNHEAAVVSRLKIAGAIILGKTVTTELATAAPGLTANPHHLSHTPGGSSSGSAAAVADGMVPLAIGSQTMGSVLRPSAYCGIFGFKPSFGLISRDGMMPVCQDLDHVGIFARYLEDIQYLFPLLLDQDNPDIQFSDDSSSLHQDKEQDYRPLASLRFAFIETPYWHQLEEDARIRLESAIQVLRQIGVTVEIVEFPSLFENYWETVQTLCAYGLYANHSAFLEHHREQCSPLLIDWFKRGQQISDSAYDLARRQGYRYRQVLNTIFKCFDAILTPVTTGAAPSALRNTGSPIFCGLWTLCGVPALNIPLGKTDGGLPLGCQLIGAPYTDQQLLQMAEQCWRFLKGAFGDIEIP